MSDEVMTSPIGTITTSQPYQIKSSKFVYFLLIAVFLLLPLYIFESGGLQFVDVPILFIMLYVLLTIRRTELQMISLPLISFSVFVFWAICLNLGYYLSDLDPTYIRAAFHIFYVFILFFTFSVLFFRLLDADDARPYIYTGILFSAIVPLLFSKGHIEAGLMVRQTFSFNNPNQLALFSLLIPALTLVLNDFFKDVDKSRKEKIIIISTSALVFILSHYYMILSASRGGIVSLLLLDMIALWKMKKKLLLVVPVVVLVAFMISNYEGLSQLDLSETKFFKRFANYDLNAKLAERTKRVPEINDIGMIIGKGKSKSEYTVVRGKEIEVHNTIVDIIFSYGLIGLSLFSIFSVLLLREIFPVKYHLAVLLTFLPMHISHNLIRFRMGWILLALIYSISLIRGNSPKVVFEQR